MYMDTLNLALQHTYIRAITISKPTYTYIYTIHEPKPHAIHPIYLAHQHTYI